VQRNGLLHQSKCAFFLLPVTFTISNQSTRQSYFCSPAIRLEPVKYRFNVRNIGNRLDFGRHAHPGYAGILVSCTNPASTISWWLCWLLLTFRNRVHKLLIVLHIKHNLIHSCINSLKTTEIEGDISGLYWLRCTLVLALSSILWYPSWTSLCNKSPRAFMRAMLKDRTLINTHRYKFPDALVMNGPETPQKCVYAQIVRWLVLNTSENILIDR